MRIEQNLHSTYPSLGEIPVEYLSGLPKDCPFYLVDGELLRWQGETEPVHSAMMASENGLLAPLHLGSCPVLDENAAMRAAKAAVDAYGRGLGEWPAMTQGERIRHLECFLERMAAVGDEIVRLMTLEICKPVRQARGEFDRTVQYVRDTIDALREMDGEDSRRFEGDDILARVRRAPLGPVLCMGPYNFPFNETFATLIPALLMGNTAVVKLPKIGRLLFSPILEALRDCFPRGVVNVITGNTELVHPILKSGCVDVFAFIGSSGAANALRELHPRPGRLRCVFGLDAKNQAVVLQDADMDVAAPEILSGSLSFSGQRCTAIKTVFVHQSRADELLERLNEGVGKLKIGMPFDPDVDITPMPEPGRAEYLRDLVDDAVSKGARVINADGGSVLGSLVHPAILYPVDSSMRVYHEEQFGPVVPVVPFDDDRTPVEYQAQSDFGQQVSLFGQNPDRLGRLVDAMSAQVCRVNLNSQCQRGPDTLPFGGRKDSAIGTLSVKDGIRAFSMRTVVASKNTDNNRALLSALQKGQTSSFLNAEHLK